MKRVTVLLSVLTLLALSLFAFPSKASASSGPVGANGLRAYPGPGVGEVTLEWQRVSLSGENYSIYYGTQSGKDQFTALNIGYIATYTVKSLTPGTKYYFRLHRIWTGGVDQGYDGEVSAVAPRGTSTVTGVSGPVGRNLLTAKAGPKSGQVTLNWTRFFSDTEGYDIVYGTKPGKYIYGALNAVNATGVISNNFNFTVGSLNSGTRYYFALVPHRAGTGIYITAEVSAVAR